ncbi:MULTISPECIES: DUF1648 domain-containing protein [Paenibacillus]|uniref:DUF1648 domain-containing protein n=1 Tax=Paenibacillus odorifer TaxID=189426 RepID=A0A1R0WSQ1_9BACL|nr:DUF1648 domain-containing protein [Paenibacillus odorifer]OMD20423.1 hypothetical protein BJP51_10115 [Paenibacillus odorifer]OME59387.1 hypothetical protein BSK61_05510 [Paenibacillus odorifer]
MTIMPVIVMILVFVPAIVLMVSMPYLTRETISFGVTVSPVQFHSEPLRQMRKSYARISATLHTILFIICILCLIYGDEHSKQPSWIIVTYSLAMVVISLVINISYYFKMKSLLPMLPIALEPSIMAVDTGFRKRNIGLSNKWFLIHVLIIVVTIVNVLRNYDLIPDQIPIHYNSSWNVDGYAAKSYSSVFMPTIMQVFITLLFIFENWSIRRVKQQVQPNDPNRSIRQDATYRRTWSYFMLTASFLIVILFSVVQLNMISQLNMNFAIPIILIIIALIILYALALTFWAGQGESRLERSADSSNVRPVHDDDKWRLGMIYFNRKDPNLIVKKRLGVGWGLNFGHPVSWLFWLGIIVLLVVVR